MSLASIALQRLLDCQSEESRRLRAEVCDLQAASQKSREEIIAIEARGIDELRKLREETTFLRSEKSRLDAETVAQQSELVGLRRTAIESGQLCLEMERDCGRLRAESAFLIDTLTRAKEDHSRERSDLLTMHEEHINTLGIEVLSLRLKVAEQDETVLLNDLFAELGLFS